jgi:hypothetical protein
VAKQVGERFVHALGNKDAEELKALLRADVDFRAMTPGRFWEATDVDVVVDDTILGKWFQPPNEITEIVDIETGSIGSRDRVGYRLKVSGPDGEYLVEQQAYFETDGDRISWLRIMCAGYQLVTPS